MIRKILGAILIIILIFFAHKLTKEEEQPVYTVDEPSLQEQQQIEIEQEAPAAALESDMEQLSPEDAEKDQ